MPAQPHDCADQAANGPGLLKRVSELESVLAYLASCEAATLEGLPKATSKTARDRQERICLMAAAALQGDFSKLGPAEKPDWARERCLQAVARSREFAMDRQEASKKR